MSGFENGVKEAFKFLEDSELQIIVSEESLVIYGLDNLNVIISSDSGEIQLCLKRVNPPTEKELEHFAYDIREVIALKDPVLAANVGNISAENSEAELEGLDDLSNLFKEFCMDALDGNDDIFNLLVANRER